MPDSDPQDTNQSMPSTAPPTTADPLVPPGVASSTPPPLTETASHPSMDYSSSTLPTTEPAAAPSDASSTPPPPTATVPPPLSDGSGTPPPPEEKKDRKKLWLIMATLLIAITIPLVVYLAQQSQEIRQRAQQPYPTATPPSDLCLTDPEGFCANVLAGTRCDEPRNVEGAPFPTETGECQTPPDCRCRSSCGQSCNNGGDCLSGICVSATAEIPYTHCGGPSCPGQPPSTPIPDPSPSPSLSPSPSPAPLCADIRLYTVTGAITNASSWNLIDTPAEQQAAYRPGNTIYITVVGSSQNAPVTFSRGRIRVNVGTTQGAFSETTNIKPKATATEPDEFYVSYIIPATLTATTTFFPQAEVCVLTGTTCNWY